MEVSELDKFQDLSNISLKNEVLTGKKDGVHTTNLSRDDKSSVKIINEEAKDQVSMFSDTDDTDIDNMNDTHINANEEGSLTESTKDDTVTVSDAKKKATSSSSCDDEFPIEQFKSSEELQAAIKRSEVNNASNCDTDVDEKSKKSVVSWIQCDKPECLKWRKLDVDDISMMSDEKWYCALNPDLTRNECCVSEEEWSEGSEDESVYTSFKPGVIVLGKMPGYPWWPGIVEDDPDFDSFFYLDRRADKVKVSYHVTFFGASPSRAWLTEVAVRKFRGDEIKEDLGQLSYNHKSFSRSVVGALADANCALQLPLERRVEKFGFLSRYKGKSHSVPEKHQKLKSKGGPVSPSAKPKHKLTLNNKWTAMSTLLEARKRAKQKESSKNEVIEADFFDHVSGDSHDDGSDFDFEMSKAKAFPRKQTARKIKEKSSKSSANGTDSKKKKSKKERKERKARKKLLRQKKKEQKLMMLEKLEGDKAYDEISEPLKKEASDEMKDVAGSETCSASNEVNDKVSTDPSNSIEKPSTTADVDEDGLSITQPADTTETDKEENQEEIDQMDVDPSVITESENQAELMVSKYVDPELVQNFLSGLETMNESFNERFAKEKAAKEAETLRKMAREEKKRLKQEAMNAKLKKREEQQAALKAKKEKKMNKAIKVTKDKENSGPKKLPSFGVKKKTPFQVKTKVLESNTSLNNVGANKKDGQPDAIRNIEEPKGVQEAALDVAKDDVQLTLGNQEKDLNVNQSGQCKNAKEDVSSSTKSEKNGALHTEGNLENEQNLDINQCGQFKDAKEDVRNLTESEKNCASRTEGDQEDEKNNENNQGGRLKNAKEDSCSSSGSATNVVPCTKGNQKEEGKLETNQCEQFTNDKEDAHRTNGNSEGLKTKTYDAENQLRESYILDSKTVEVPHCPENSKENEPLENKKEIQLEKGSSSKGLFTSALDGGDNQLEEPSTSESKKVEVPHSAENSRVLQLSENKEEKVSSAKGLFMSALDIGQEETIGSKCDNVEDEKQVTPTLSPKAPITKKSVTPKPVINDGPKIVPSFAQKKTGNKRTVDKHETSHAPRTKKAK